MVEGWPGYSCCQKLKKMQTKLKEMEEHSFQQPETIDLFSFREIEEPLKIWFFPPPQNVGVNYFFGLDGVHFLRAFGYTF